MSKAHYICSQSALYQVSRNVALSLQKNLEAFTAFKPKYNSAYLLHLNNTITHTENLPSFQARSAQSEIDYLHLCVHLKASLLLCKTLKRYILSAYPISQHTPRLQEAGAQHYQPALFKKWSQATALLTNAANFITLHSPVLQAAQNMPATFPATFTHQANLFATSLLTYQKSREKLKINTANNIKANNTLYTAIIEICLDGQIIFNSNPPLQQQFIFTNVHRLVSGIGTTGLKGHITNADTTQPIANTTIQTFPTTKTVTTNTEGHFHLSHIPHGTYLITITAIGYQTLQIPNYQIDSGISHILNIPLHPI